MEMIRALWVAFMLRLFPTAPTDRLGSVVDTVMEVTSDPHEQAVLLTISAYETGAGRRGIPFGTSSMPLWAKIDPLCRDTRHRRCPRVRVTPTVLERARWALALIRRSVRLCPRRVAHQLGHYHHGNGCWPDSYSLHEEATVFRMRDWLLSHNVALVEMPRPPRTALALRTP